MLKYLYADIIKQNALFYSSNENIVRVTFENNDFFFFFKNTLQYREFGWMFCLIIIKMSLWRKLE